MILGTFYYNTSYYDYKKLQEVILDLRTLLNRYDILLTLKEKNSFLRAEKLGRLFDTERELIKMRTEIYAL